MRVKAILLSLTSLLILSGCPATGLKIYSHQVDGLYSETNDKDFVPHEQAAGNYGCLSWSDIRAVVERLNSCENIGVGL